MKRRITLLNPKKSERSYTKMKYILMGEQRYRKLIGMEIREDKGQCDINSRTIKKIWMCKFFCSPDC